MLFYSDHNRALIKCNFAVLGVIFLKEDDFTSKVNYNLCQVLDLWKRIRKNANVLESVSTSC